MSKNNNQNRGGNNSHQGGGGGQNHRGGGGHHNGGGNNQNRGGNNSHHGGGGNQGKNTPPAQPLLLLPNDTKSIMQVQQFYSLVENFHLRFNKYIKAEPKKGGAEYEWTAIFKNNDIKREFFTFSDSNKNSYKEILAKLNAQFKEGLKVKADFGQNVHSFSLKTIWRLVIGLGRESTLETSMTLHHTYGFPYIPSTSLKGIVRSFIMLEYFGGSESAAMQDQGFGAIFGTGSVKENGKMIEFPESRGAIIFYDAYPETFTEENLEVDIINCHFQPYYSKGEPPADYHDPIPVNFLTVKNCKFNFAFSINGNSNQRITEGAFAGKTPYEVIAREMVEALKNHGIGAKTAVGYGLFA